MLRHQTTYLVTSLLLVLSGCQSTDSSRVGLKTYDRHVTEKPVAYQPTRSDLLQRAKSERGTADIADPVAAERTAAVPSAPFPESPSARIAPGIRTVSHEPQPAPAESGNATLTIDGKTYRVKLSPDESSTPIIQTAAGEKPPMLPLPDDAVESADSQLVELETISSEEDQYYPLDLPTALGMVGGQHPVIGFAQWRVQEAYAQLDRAEALWLPSLQAGFSYHRHDGNTQTTSGSIVDLNRNSFNYGLGAGANAAGTQPFPGVVAQFHVADAIFQPDIAQKNAWARGFAASAVQNNQLLDAALAYIELLSAEQDRVILEESRERTEVLAKLTSDYAMTGQGLQADADRLATELVLVNSRVAEATEQADVAAARLARELSFDSGQRIVPADPTVVPIDLVPPDYNKGTLISTGLSNRPELKEAQNLVSAACDEYKRQKYAPFIPSVLLGFSSDGFGGGLGNDASNFGSRYDVDAMMLWQVRNLGFGERAARREMMSRVEQTKYEKVRLLDQVSAEISEAHAQVIHRRRRIDITREAILSAQNSYDRNLNRIRDGQGLPIEALQSLRALEESRRAYLNAVVDYNRAQFQLQWALGWQVVAPPDNG